MFNWDGTISFHKPYVFSIWEYNKKRNTFIWHHYRDNFFMLTPIYTISHGDAESKEKKNYQPKQGHLLLAVGIYYLSSDRPDVNVCSCAAYRELTSTATAPPYPWKSKEMIRPPHLHCFCNFKMYKYISLKGAPFNLQERSGLDYFLNKYFENELSWNN